MVANSGANASRIGISTLGSTSAVETSSENVGTVLDSLGCAWSEIPAEGDLTFSFDLRSGYDILFDEISDVSLSGGVRGLCGAEA